MALNLTRCVPCLSGMLHCCLALLMLPTTVWAAPVVYGGVTLEVDSVRRLGGDAVAFSLREEKAVTTEAELPRAVAIRYAAPEAVSLLPSREVGIMEVFAIESGDRALALQLLRAVLSVDSMRSNFTEEVLTRIVESKKGQEFIVEQAQEQSLRNDKRASCRLLFSIVESKRDAPDAALSKCSDEGVIRFRELLEKGKVEEAFLFMQLLSNDYVALGEGRSQTFFQVVHSTYEAAKRGDVNAFSSGVDAMYGDTQPAQARVTQAILSELLHRAAKDRQYAVALKALEYSDFLARTPRDHEAVVAILRGIPEEDFNCLNVGAARWILEQYSQKDEEISRLLGDRVEVKTSASQPLVRISQRGALVVLASVSLLIAALVAVTSRWFLRGRGRGEQGRGSAGRTKVDEEGEERRSEEPSALEDDYWRLLGFFQLKPGASLSEIKAAYRRCVKNLHPDGCRSDGAALSDDFIEVTERYKRLKDLYQLLHNAS